MAEASINDVVNKLAEISDTLKKMSGAAASTYAAQQEKYRADYEARSKQPAAKQQQDTDAFAKNLAEHVFGRKSPGDLSSKERSRYKKIGEILKPIFNAEGIIKSLGKFTDNITENIEQQHRESLLQRVTKTAQAKAPETKGDKDQPKKQSWFESIVSNIGTKLLGGAALLAIGMGLAHLLKGTIALEKIDAKKLVAFSLAFGAAAWGLSKVLSSFSKMGGMLLLGAVSFGIIASALNKNVVPAIQSLSQVSWKSVQGGIASMVAVLGTMITSLAVLSNGSDLKSLLGRGNNTWGDALKNVLKTGTGLLGIYALTRILHEQLVPALIGLSLVKWDEVKGGLAAASVALGGLTLLTGAIAKVLDDPSMARQGKKILSALLAGGAVFGLVKLLGELAVNMKSFAAFDWKKIGDSVWGAEAALGGMAAIVGAIGTVLYLTKGAGLFAGGTALLGMYALAANLGYVAESLAKYSAVDPDKLKAVGDSLLPLSKGLGAFLGVFGIGGIVASVSNIMDSIMSIFDRDVVGVIIKFESINAAKLTAVGESLKLLAEGLAATLQSAKLSTAGAKESAKAVSEFIGVLSILKSTLPGNTLQIKIRGDIDENLVKTIDKLAIDFRDINNLSLQTNSDKLADAIDKANAKQISVSGITELQKIIKDLNMVEIDLLTEQRDILKDVRTTLRESNMHLQALTAGGANVSTPMGSKSYIREERSSTREHYLQNTNLFKSTIK